MGRAQPRVSLIIKLWLEDKMFENAVMFHKVIIMFMMTWPPPPWWLIHEILWVNYGLARDKLLQLIQYQNTGISLIHLNTKRCYAHLHIPGQGSDIRTSANIKGFHSYSVFSWLFLTFQLQCCFNTYGGKSISYYYKGHWWRLITINLKKCTVWIMHSGFTNSGVINMLAIFTLG